MRAIFVAVLVVAQGAGACKGDGGPDGVPLVCRPLTSTSCSCGPGGLTGVATCDADGKAYGACDCAGADAAAVQDQSVALDLSSADLTAPPDLAQPIAAPLAYWKLDESGGTTAADAEGSFPGTVTAGTFVAGKHNNALQCDGATTYVALGNPAGLQLTGAMSIGAWIKIGSYSTSGRILSKGGGPGMRGWSLNVESTGVTRFMIAVDANTNVSADSAANAIATGQWAHVAGVYAPGVALRLYIDGALVAENTTGIPATQHDSGLDAYICRRSDGVYFDGVVDDLRLYDFALSAAQVVGVAK